MHPVTIYRRLPYGVYGEVKLVLARDPQQQLFVGVALDGRDAGRFVFIQVDPQTIRELEARTIDLHTLITERGRGIAFEGRPAADETEAAADPVGAPLAAEP